MRYMPIVLLLGILLNFGCVLLFRLKSERRFRSDYEQLSSAVNAQIMDFSSSALKRIDDYFLSNRATRVSSAISSAPTVQEVDILYKDSGDWDYFFCRVNGSPLARVGIVDFSIGSPFPRGGYITAIFPDFVVVNDSLVFRNRSFSASAFHSKSLRSDIQPLELSTPDTTYKPNKELLNHVSGTNTSSK